MNSDQSDLKNSAQETCSCIACKNNATRYLRIVSKPKAGHYCDQCATDLKWHGIAKEVHNC